MKKVFQIIGISILTCFSFYYTDKMIELSETKDPLMIQIVNKQDDFNSYALDSIINDDYILSGSLGQIIDIKQSYQRMKKLGKYNENLLIYTKDNPKSLLKDNLDKFVVGVNTNKYDIALIIKVNNSSNLDRILNILSSNDVKVNFFVDGFVGENNPYVVNSIAKNNHYIGNLGYNNIYTSSHIEYTNNLFKKYANYDIKYCYSYDDNYEILNVCKDKKMNTVKPSYEINNYLYQNIKDNLKKGNIYSLENNNYIVDELDITLKYIKQKGYNIKILSDFFN